MPELPEVETVRRGLEPHLVHATLKRVEARRADLRFPLPQGFAERLEGQRILSLERRAKYLIAQLSNAQCLIMHLGMTGRFTLVAKGKGETLGEYVYDTGADPRHDHVVFHLSNGADVVYNDPRRFGFMLLIADSERDAHPLFRHMGTEPLGSGLTAEYLARRAHGKKVNLKTFLMDQRIVAGIGNIYASEALWRAGLKPGRAAHTLADARGRPTERAHALVPAIRTVLEDAIRAGGSTLKDYRNAGGGEGAFQESFAVYDRDGAPCARTGCGGRIRRSVISGRATYACSRCQR